MSEVEIRDELKDQGVVEENRVTLKKEGKVIPTNTLFLTFGSPELPNEITVGSLKVKVHFGIKYFEECFVYCFLVFLKSFAKTYYRFSPLLLSGLYPACNSVSW